MAYIQTAPVFADRYRFEPVPNDWDTGRSGTTFLVYDLEKERLGVIKRAHITTKQAVAELRNEISALKALKGSGVPEVYEVGQSIYDSKKYEYMVIEYVGGLRLEENLTHLNVSERIEILIQLFALLTKSHSMGIVNGDVDLKHLFWHKDKKQLTIIDWGNAKLVSDPRKKTEFAYDLARSAEIIYSVLTLKGYPPATGSLALPNDSLLHSGLTPIPDELRKLCKWAHRTPIEGAQSPNTSLEIYTSVTNWGKLIQSQNFRKRSSVQIRVLRLLSLLTTIFLITTIVAIYFANQFRSQIPATPEETQRLEFTNTPKTAPTQTIESTETPIAISTERVTALPDIIPSPGIYNQILLLFDKYKYSVPDKYGCWTNRTNSETQLNPVEGFGIRHDRYFGFTSQRGRTIGDLIQTDFNTCLRSSYVNAMSLNAWIERLEIERQSPNDPEILDPGKEFGMFIESANGQRREYTVWIDKNKSMHLRVRENNQVTLDNTILIVNSLNVEGSFPRLYSQFSIQIFLELNNQGVDLLYLREGSGQKPINSENINPNQMIRIDGATRIAMNEIKSIGLIGYGGDTQMIIWPLVFYGEIK